MLKLRSETTVTFPDTSLVYYWITQRKSTWKIPKKYKESIFILPTFEKTENTTFSLRRTQIDYI